MKLSMSAAMAALPTITTPVLEEDTSKSTGYFENILATIMASARPKGQKKSSGSQLPWSVKAARAYHKQQADLRRQFPSNGKFLKNGKYVDRNAA